jgi:hypothetical protein
MDTDKKGPDRGRELWLRQESASEAACAAGSTIRNLRNATSIRDSEDGREALVSPQEGFQNAPLKTPLRDPPGAITESRYNQKQCERLNRNRKFFP